MQRETVWQRAGDRKEYCEECHIWRWWRYPILFSETLGNLDSHGAWGFEPASHQGNQRTEEMHKEVTSHFFTLLTGCTVCIASSFSKAILCFILIYLSSIWPKLLSEYKEYSWWLLGSMCNEKVRIWEVRLGLEQCKWILDLCSMSITSSILMKSSDIRASSTVYSHSHFKAVRCIQLCLASKAFNIISARHCNSAFPWNPHNLKSSVSTLMLHMLSTTFSLAKLDYCSSPLAEISS